MGKNMLQKKELETEQLRKLKILLNYAGIHVPYYRQKFRELRIGLDDINSFYDFQRVPFLVRKTIQKQWHDFLSDEYQEKNLIFRFTSGTTGEPLKCAMTHQERIIAGRHLFRARTRWELDFPARCALLGGATHFAIGDPNSYRDKFSLSKNVLLLLPVLDLSASSLDKYLQELLSFQPNWIYGLPSGVAQIAAHASKNNQRLELPGLKLIELAGEFLTHEHRQVISDVFQISPANQYACSELWGIAFECSLGGMHLLTEHVYVEIIGTKGEDLPLGEIGEVVITGLNNRSQPFIRYKTGDLAKLCNVPCPCGDSHPTIELVDGRVTQRIVGAEEKIGTLIFDAIVKGLFTRGLGGIAQYCVIQRSTILFQVCIVKDYTWTQECQFFFEEQAKKMLGSHIKLQFTFVDKITEQISGKRFSFIVDIKS